MANAVSYGFISLQDIYASRVVDTNPTLIRDAIQRSLDEHNRQLAAINALFVQPTTERTVRYRTPTNHRLQPLDENGRTRPVKVAGYYDVGFPIQMAGSAWGANWLTLEKMSVADADEATAAMLVADRRWMRDHILAALFTNVTWTHADQLYGDITVQSLANADAVLYQTLSGGDVGATSQKFFAQAAAIANNANPFPVLHNALTQHPENGTTVIALIPTNLRAAVEALATFTMATDPNLSPGTGVTQLTGRLGRAVPGVVFGYETSGVWLVEWRSLPDDYIVAVSGEGPRPLGMRQEPEASLQGFREVAERRDHPWAERQWVRLAGFGAWNRVGAAVYRIGDAAYAIPTGYASPMP